MPPHHDLVADLAGRQLGLLTRPQLLANGMSYARIRSRVDGGHLVPVGNKTFRVAGTPRSYEGDLLAACLDTGGVASHRAAARLHGLQGFRDTPVVEVTVVKGRRNLSSLGTVHATTNLPPDDLVEVGPIPATSVARTILGLAALVPHEVSLPQLHGAIEGAAHTNEALDRWLCWRLEKLRCRGRNGVLVMEGVLRARLRLGPTESWLEREMLRLLGEAGLPLPQVQRRLRRRGLFAARVDFLYPEHGLVLEVDGHASHRTREQTAADARRQNELILAGYRVLRFTYDDVVRRARWVTSSVAEALDQAPVG